VDLTVDSLQAFWGERIDETLHDFPVTSCESCCDVAVGPPCEAAQ